MSDCKTDCIVQLESARPKLELLLAKQMCGTQGAPQIAAHQILQRALVLCARGLIRKRVKSKALHSACVHVSLLTTAIASITAVAAIALANVLRCILTDKGLILILNYFGASKNKFY